MNLINAIDQKILFFIQDNMHSVILDKIMIFLTFLGDKGLIWFAFAALLLVTKKTRLIGIMTLTAMILATFMGEGLLKHIIMRPRPYTDFPYVQLLIEKSTPYSFPSAHTTFSFSAAYVLSAYVKKYSIVFWSTAVAISLSRLYLFMHYPTDVVAGIVLGLLCGKAVVTLFQRKFEKSARGTFPLA